MVRSAKRVSNPEAPARACILRDAANAAPQDEEMQPLVAQLGEKT
jgi:hypothetical protein